MPESIVVGNKPTNEFSKYIRLMASNQRVESDAKSSSFLVNPNNFNPAGPPPIPINGVGASMATPAMQKIVAKAQSYLGVPYVWGGNGYSGIDCSGFVQQCYASVGISLPRTSSQQVNVGVKVNFSSLADMNNLVPGDRIYFTYNGRVAGHTGIYIGNGQMIHASSGSRKVVIVPLTQHHITHLHSVMRSQ